MKKFEEFLAETDPNLLDEVKKGWKNKKTHPAKDLSKEEKSDVVKAAKKGEDIGEKGKHFNDVAEKAAKKYGSKEAGERVAAAAMWKKIKK